MIYVVISDGLNRQGGIINKNGDCRVLRQPQSLLPREIENYVGSAKNEYVRSERRLAYTSLLSSLKAFFDIDGVRLSKNENGKPYLNDSNISISLSHSDGITAVALSNEGEVGVDIQCEVDREKSKRLESRFLSDIIPCTEALDIEYYYACFKDNEVIFEKIEPQPDTDTDFLSRWVYTESNIKCFGLTFSDISKIKDYAQKAKTQTVSINNFKIATTIAK